MAEKLEPQLVICQGAYDARQDVVTSNPGGATYMQNYEPGLYGGYRRINGTAKYIATAVTGTGSVLGVAIFNNTTVIGCRGTAGDGSVYKWNGAAWVKINTDVRTITTERYRHCRYTWSTKRIMFADGVNVAAKWDGTTWTKIDGAGGPADPKYVAEFLNRIAYAGYSAKPGAIILSSPNLENDFVGANGAIELVVGDTITGLRSFRDKLIIFCQNSIFQLTGTNSATFDVSPVSRTVGCIAPDSIQEANGDIYYLSTDGIRTVAATGRIDDFELGNVSKKIQPVLNTISTEHMASVIIPSKSQYRLFYHDTSFDEDACLGVLGGLRVLNTQMQNSYYGAVINDQIQWEWSALKGIKPYCCDYDHVNMVDTALHGGYDGYIYQQDTGNSLAGSALEAIFKTPDHDMKDPGKRKFIHRITPYIRREGASTITLSVYYNYNATSILQPAAYTLTGSGSTSLYGSAIYGTSTYGSRPDIMQRQPVEGSGFTISLQFYSNSATDIAYSIEAYMIEAQMAGRR